MKRLGWTDFSQNFFAFLFNQKFVHVVVVIVTFLIVFSNVATKSKAYAYYDNSNKTILSSLIESEFSTLEEEQLIEEFFDQEAVISPTQKNYLDNLTNLQSQPRVLRQSPDELDDEGKNVSTTQEGAALVKPEIATTKKTKRPRTETIEYMVKPGDTVSTIAANFEVSVNTILWENSLSAYSIIRPGNKLTILPSSGITHSVSSGDTLSSIAKKYDVEEDRILTNNKLAKADPLKIGDKLFVPDGKKQVYASYSPNTYSGYTAIKSLVTPNDAKPVSGNMMNWPTEGHRITQYYSWRHTGLDIANKIGTPIYAADAGTVEVLGWGTGYGNQILIDHGGGKKTRYAHLSEFFVEKGDTVTKGQTIAAMGSTGWSTGSHLHFEVIINNAKYNPLNYIK